MSKTRFLEQRQTIESFAYDVYLCSYNAQDNIQAVIESIYAQTIKPRKVKVFDDNSGDYTSIILLMLEQYYDTLDVEVSNEFHYYDTSRLPQNINKMLDTKDGYIMILSDDVLLPAHYVESLAKHLEANKSIVIISGNENNFKSNIPRGSGRLIDSNFFNKSVFAGKFPENICWETALVFLAQFEGYDVKCMNEVHYRHIRPNGSKHGFNNYGQMMSDLGYSRLYVISRIAKNFITGYEFPRRKALKILIDYFNAKPTQLYSKELKTFIRNKQHNRIIQMIKAL